jgi:hypothetical protein
MRASRIETRQPIARIAALLSALLLGAVPAAAQLGAPVPLLPPKPAAPQSGASAPPAAPEPTDPNAVTAAPLAPTDASWAGTLGFENGAFPQTMWQGTPRGFVAAALPLMAPTISPTLHDLARRLLLSNAAAPQGADSPDRPTLAMARLDRIVAIGEIAGALAVARDMNDPSGDGLDRQRVELHFAANDPGGACASVEDLIKRYQGLWWERALIGCQALQGDGAKASLGLSLLREQKAAPDPAFEALIDVLGGRPRKIDRLPDPSPLRMTLLGAAKQPLPSDVFTVATPAALLAYASQEALPPERRLAAAERAAMLGAMPLEQLAALYQQIDAKPDEQTAALKPGKLPDDPRSRAVLYNVARSAAPPETRAAAIAALLAEARPRAAFPFTARLLAGPIGELRPDDVPALAGDAARALLVAGQLDAARPWVEAAHSKVMTLLGDLAQPPVNEQEPPELLHDGATELMEHNGGAAPAQADLLLALLAAFDARPGAADWTVLLAPPHDAKLPSAALWVAQEQAAAAKRVGETVLTSLLIVQAGERLSLEPVLLSRAIAGLRVIGREPDARALAVEAAVDAGL